MPATINLRTIPGSIERGDRYDAKTLDLFGPSLGQESVVVATVADVRAAVQAFGARLRAAHPDASFMVSVSVRKGDRKPRGYDAAIGNNGSARRTTCGSWTSGPRRPPQPHPTPHRRGIMDLTPVAAWGDRTTPFQLDGHAPVERRPPDNRLWDYAGQDLGFYGFLRIAHTRILRRIGLGLLDLSHRRWRDAYLERQHPWAAADKAIADEAAEMGCEL